MKEKYFLMHGNIKKYGNINNALGCKNSYELYEKQFVSNYL